MIESAELRQAIGQALIDRISLISENNWCAGWMYGIEYMLWWAIHDPHFLDNGIDWKNQMIEPGELRVLKGMHELIGGWCDHRSIMPTEEWVTKYEAEKDKHIKLDDVMQDGMG